MDFGTVTIDKPGVQTVRMLYREDKAWKPVNLRDVILTPLESR
ncbi:MAG: hypothetical protein U1G05_08615 [Kiritimatiellia bacterium]